MKWLFMALVTLVILGIGGYTLAGRTLTGNAALGADLEVKEYNIEAFQFGYKPDLIKVKQGDNVKIVVNNLDVPHGIRIPDLGVSGETEISFTANKKGEFRWYCYIPCGSGHGKMNGKLIVE